MINAILIPANPFQCLNIASEKQTIILTKTKPKLDTPFKCYIYCTKDKWQHLVQMPDKSYRIYNGKEYGKYDKSLIFSGEANCKVIGEFVCDAIISHCEMANADIAEQQGYIKREKLLKYAGDKEIYGWHISDLVIYDKPKELSEFTGLRKTKFGYEPVKMQRPPQSWCYVEELK